MRLVREQPCVRSKKGYREKSSSRESAVESEGLSYRRIQRGLALSERYLRDPRELVPPPDRSQLESKCEISACGQIDDEREFHR